MKENVTDRVALRAFEGVRGDREPNEEDFERYDRLLRELDPEICVMAVWGRIGHWRSMTHQQSFEANDLIRIVDMDEISHGTQDGTRRDTSHRLDEAKRQRRSASPPSAHC